MGQPAVVQNDSIKGLCPAHQIPNPSSGAPQPAGPLPFAAPLTMALAMTVKIGRKPAAVQDSQGLNTPPHAPPNSPPLHASDPNMAPPTQIGRVVQGSATVKFEGKPAAYTGCPVAMCADAPGQVVGTGTTVMIGT